MHASVKPGAPFPGSPWKSELNASTPCSWLSADRTLLRDLRGTLQHYDAGLSTVSQSWQHALV